MQKRKGTFIIILILIILLTMINQIIFTDGISQEYFPKGIFYDREELDSFINSWYSKNLIAFNEPSLYELSSDTNIICYRFVCLRTFDNPFLIRILQNKDGTGLLYFKRSSGAGGYEPGELIEEKTIVISKENMNKLLNKIENEHYWKLDNKDRSMGCDGSQWIIEGIKNGNYHLVDRWSPETGSIKVLGLYFIELAQMTIKNLY